MSRNLRWFGPCIREVAVQADILIIGELMEMAAGAEHFGCDLFGMYIIELTPKGLEALGHLKTLEELMPSFGVEG